MTGPCVTFLPIPNLINGGATSKTFIFWPYEDVTGAPQGPIGQPKPLSIIATGNVLHKPEAEYALSAHQYNVAVNRAIDLIKAGKAKVLGLDPSRVQCQGGLPTTFPRSIVRLKYNPPDWVGYGVDGPAEPYAPADGSASGTAPSAEGGGVAAEVPAAVEGKGNSPTPMRLDRSISSSSTGSNSGRAKASMFLLGPKVESFKIELMLLQATPEVAARLQRCTYFLLLCPDDLFPWVTTLQQPSPYMPQHPSALKQESEAPAEEEGQVSSPPSQSKGRTATPPNSSKGSKAGRLSSGRPNAAPVGLLEASTSTSLASAMAEEAVLQASPVKKANETDSPAPRLKNTHDAGQRDSASGGGDLLGGGGQPATCTPPREGATPGAQDASPSKQQQQDKEEDEEEGEKGGPAALPSVGVGVEEDDSSDVEMVGIIRPGESQLIVGAQPTPLVRPRWQEPSTSKTNPEGEGDGRGGDEGGKKPRAEGQGAMRPSTGGGKGQPAVDAMPINPRPGPSTGKKPRAKGPGKEPWSGGGEEGQPPADALQAELVIAAPANEPKPQRDVRAESQDEEAAMEVETPTTSAEERLPSDKSAGPKSQRAKASRRATPQAKPTPSAPHPPRPADTQQSPPSGSKPARAKPAVPQAAAPPPAPPAIPAIAPKPAAKPKPGTDASAAPSCNTAPRAKGQRKAPSSEGGGGAADAMALDPTPAPSTSRGTQPTPLVAAPFDTPKPQRDVRAANQDEKQGAATMEVETPLARDEEHALHPTRPTDSQQSPPSGSKLSKAKRAAPQAAAPPPVPPAIPAIAPKPIAKPTPSTESSTRPSSTIAPRAGVQKSSAPTPSPSRPPPQPPTPPTATNSAGPCSTLTLSHRVTSEEKREVPPFTIPKRPVPQAAPAPAPPRAASGFPPMPTRGGGGEGAGRQSRTHYGPAPPPPPDVSAYKRRQGEMQPGLITRNDLRQGQQTAARATSQLPSSVRRGVWGQVPGARGSRNGGQEGQAGREDGRENRSDQPPRQELARPQVPVPMSTTARTVTSNPPGNPRDPRLRRDSVDMEHTVVKSESSEQAPADTRPISAPSAPPLFDGKSPQETERQISRAVPQASTETGSVLHSSEWLHSSAVVFNALNQPYANAGIHPSSAGQPVMHDVGGMATLGAAQITAPRLAALGTQDTRGPEMSVNSREAGGIQAPTAESTSNERVYRDFQRAISSQGDLRNPEPTRTVTSDGAAPGHSSNTSSVSHTGAERRWHPMSESENQWWADYQAGRNRAPQHPLLRGLAPQPQSIIQAPPHGMPCAAGVGRLVAIPGRGVAVIGPALPASVHIQQPPVALHPPVSSSPASNAQASHHGDRNAEGSRRSFEAGRRDSDDEPREERRGQEKAAKQQRRRQQAAAWKQDEERRKRQTLEDLVDPTDDAERGQEGQSRLPRSPVRRVGSNVDSRDRGDHIVDRSNARGNGRPQLRRRTSSGSSERGSADEAQRGHNGQPGPPRSPVRRASWMNADSGDRRDDNVDRSNDQGNERPKLRRRTSSGSSERGPADDAQRGQRQEGQPRLPRSPDRPGGSNVNSPDRRGDNVERSNDRGYGRPQLRRRTSSGSSERGWSGNRGEKRTWEQVERTNDSAAGSDSDARGGRGYRGPQGRGRNGFDVMHPWARYQPAQRGDYHQHRRRSPSSSSSPRRGVREGRQYSGARGRPDRRDGRRSRSRSRSPSRKSASPRRRRSNSRERRSPSSTSSERRRMMEREGKKKRMRGCRGGAEEQQRKLKRKRKKARKEKRKRHRRGGSRSNSRGKGARKGAGSDSGTERGGGADDQRRKSGAGIRSGDDRKIAHRRSDSSTRSHSKPREDSSDSENCGGSSSSGSETRTSGNQGAGGR